MTNAFKFDYAKEYIQSPPHCGQTLNVNGEEEEGRSIHHRFAGKRKITVVAPDDLGANIQTRLTDPRSRLDN